jgi:hypothetical protein
MSKSHCVSNAHQEWDCIIKWSVTGFKFTAEKWCAPCQEKHSNAIQEGRVIKKDGTESKPRRGRKTAKKSGSSDDGH